jgi:hypothetical protein
MDRTNACPSSRSPRDCHARGVLLVSARGRLATGTLRLVEFPSYRFGLHIDPTWIIIFSSKVGRDLIPGQFRLLLGGDLMRNVPIGSPFIFLISGTMLVTSGLIGGAVAQAYNAPPMPGHDFWSSEAGQRGLPGNISPGGVQCANLLLLSASVPQLKTTPDFKYCSEHAGNNKLKDD